MRRSVIVTVGVCLAFFVIFASAVVASPATGEVAYRQNFGDVSSLESAGITVGTRNTGSSVVSISQGYLELGDPMGDRTFALLPFYNCYSDYTVRFTFSFTEAVRHSGYVSLMLTSRGEGPDNITAVRIRADGECEGFSALSQRMIYALKTGEEVSVSVPVCGGVLESITVSTAGISETLAIDNIVNVIEGTIGFSVRNASVRIGEIAVAAGVGFEKETGVYSEMSTWTDETPYISPVSFARIDARVVSEPAPAADVVEAPVTGDASVVVSLILFIALAFSVPVLRRKRNA